MAVHTYQIVVIVLPFLLLQIQEMGLRPHDVIDAEVGCYERLIQFVRLVGFAALQVLGLQESQVHISSRGQNGLLVVPQACLIYLSSATCQVARQAA